MNGAAHRVEEHAILICSADLCEEEIEEVSIEELTLSIQLDI